MEANNPVRTASGGTQVKPGPWWLSGIILSFACLLLTLSAPHLFWPAPLAGTIARQDMPALHSLEIIDSTATRQLVDQAQQSVLPVFKRDHSHDQQMLMHLTQLLNATEKLQVDCHLPLPAKLELNARQQAYLLQASSGVWQQMVDDLVSNHRHSEQVSEAVRPQIEAAIQARLNRSKADSIEIINQSRQAYQKLSSAPYHDHDLLLLATSVAAADWKAVRASMEHATSRVLQLSALFPDAPKSDWQQSVLEFLPESWTESLRIAAASAIVKVLQPTVSIDKEGTRLKMQTAKASIKPLLKSVQKGDIVVPKGQVISAEDLPALQNKGDWSTEILPLLASVGSSLLAAFFLLGLLLNTYEPKHLFSTSSVGLISTVSVVTCGVAAFVGKEYPQFVPLPAAALALTVFTSARLSFLVVAILLILMGVCDLINFNYIIALGAASCVAITSNIKQRRDFLLTGMLIGLAQIGGYLLAATLSKTLPSLDAIGPELSLQLLGGLSSCIVAVGSLPFLESIFGMVTQFRLAELTDPTQPLLRQLEELAPGTYQHSLAVANLAEAGARAIGGDVFLVRAGSLYHDIGKMVRPRYFIENQLGDKNPHDEITPEESRDRVLAHVTDGMVLAAKHGIPKAVQDFIPQHQGTTLMAYFYHKACLRDGLDKVDASFYRYPGPRPQTREAAIVMLADVSEAVTHSLKDPSQDEVEAAISGVFNARRDDGQFLESGLTNEELEKVKKAFARVWRTLHHERLKYPSTTTGRMPVPPVPPPSEPPGCC